MYNEELEQLIDAALADGVLTDKEKKVLFKKAESLGVDHDEFEMVLDARLTKAQALKRPSNEKLGNIATCPNCGAQIKGGLAVCPECGYEFRNVEGNRSILKFKQGLEDLLKKVKDSDAERRLKENYFTTFPIPNTSEDLLEFLSFVREPAKKHSVSGFFSIANNDNAYNEYFYWLLYSRCIAKAKINFATDPRFIPYFEHYDDEASKKITPEIKNGLLEVLSTLLIFVVVGALIMLCGYLESE